MFNYTFIYGIISSNNNNNNNNKEISKNRSEMIRNKCLVDTIDDDDSSFIHSE